MSEAASTIEARGALLLALRQAGMRDVDVLRAIETVQREIFVPFSLRDIAQRNCPLPIACGQTMEAPGVLAQMLEALQLDANHRVMEIGAGSGYSTAVLSRLVREVVSFERFRTLSLEARARLEQLGIVNAAVHYADGLAEPEKFGRFDRIIVHALLPEPDARLRGALTHDGLLLCAVPDASGQGATCALVHADGREARSFRAGRFSLALIGVAAAL